MYNIIIIHRVLRFIAMHAIIQLQPLKQGALSAPGRYLNGVISACGVYYN